MAKRRFPNQAMVSELGGVDPYAEVHEEEEEIDMEANPFMFTQSELNQRTSAVTGRGARAAKGRSVGYDPSIRAPMEMMGRPGQELPIKTIGSIPSNMKGIGGLSPEEAYDKWQKMKQGMSPEEVAEMTSGGMISLRTYDIDTIGKAMGYSPEQIEGALDPQANLSDDNMLFLRGLNSLIPDENNRLNLKGNWDLYNLAKMRGGAGLGHKLPLSPERQKEQVRSYELMQHRAGGRDGPSWSGGVTERVMSDMVRAAKSSAGGRDSVYSRSATDEQIRQGIAAGLQPGDEFNNSQFRQPQGLQYHTYDERLAAEQVGLKQQLDQMTAGDLYKGTIRRQRQGLKRSHKPGLVGTIGKAAVMGLVGMGAGAILGPLVGAAAGSVFGGGASALPAAGVGLGAIEGATGAQLAALGVTGPVASAGATSGGLLSGLGSLASGVGDFLGIGTGTPTLGSLAAGATKQALGVGLDTYSTMQAQPPGAGSNISTGYDPQKNKKGVSSLTGNPYFEDDIGDMTSLQQRLV